MKLKSVLVSGLLGATAIVPAQKAEAFFGPTCIPTLHNCYCTYLSPCPASDEVFADFEKQKEETANKINDALKASNDVVSELTKSYSGSTSTLLSGLESLGIDIIDMLPENVNEVFNKLNEIDPSVIANIANGSYDFAALSSELEKLGIDPRRITIPTPDGIINGLGEKASQITSDFEITVDQISGLKDAIDKIESAKNNLESVATSKVVSKISEAAGIDITSKEFMDKMLNGEISSADLIGFLNQQGISDKSLSAMGIQEDSITRLKSGFFQAQDILDLSAPLGIKEQALESLDLGKTKLTELAEGKITTEEFTQAAKRVGLTDSDLSKLGYTPEKLSKVEESTPETIDQNVADTVEAATGPAPEATQIPVEPASPLSENPQPTEPALGALCDTETTLISSQVAPNGFGDDVAQIDLKMSSGDLDQYVEAIRQATMTAVDASTTTLGRGLQTKNILVKAYENYETFENAIGEQESLTDDLKFNDAIRLQLMMATAEVTSLYTFLASNEAAKVIGTRYISPTPNMPHNDDFVRVYKSDAETRTAAMQTASDKQVAVSQDVSDYQDQIQKLARDIDRRRSAELIAVGIPSLVETIESHDKMKADVFYLEEIIRNAAARIFVNGDAAANSIISDLRLQSGSYDADIDNYDASRIAASAIQNRITQSLSPYGTKIEPTTLNELANRSYPEYPYEYPYVDESSQDYPYNIFIPPLAGVTEDDDGYRPPLLGLFQYYLEAVRREAYFGAMRRGEPDKTMSMEAWNEFSIYAPECLTAPFPTTDEDLAIRPQWFDLSAACMHLIYEGGDARDYIDPNNLGGTDAILWRSKIIVDRAIPLDGLPVDIEARTIELLDKAVELSQRAAEVGYDGLRADIDALTNKIK